MILEQRVEAPWAGDALRIWNAASNAEYLPQCHGVRQRGVVWRVARSFPTLREGAARAVRASRLVGPNARGRRTEDSAHVGASVRLHSRYERLRE